MTFEGYWQCGVYGTEFTWICMTCRQRAADRFAILHSEECHWSRERAGLAFQHDRIAKIIDETWEKNNK